MDSLEDEIRRLKEENTEAGDDGESESEAEVEDAEADVNADEPVISGRNGVSEEFKDNLREWLDISKQIEATNADMREIRKRKVQIEEIIKEDMKKQKIANLNIPGAQIQITLKTTKIVKPLKKEDIFSSLVELFGDERAHTVVEHIFSKRTYVETERLGKRKKSK